MNRIKSGIKNIDKVAKAVTKRVLNIDSTEAERRLSICNTCMHSIPDKVFGGEMCGAKDENGEICLCPIKNLIYSDKICVLKKW